MPPDSVELYEEYNMDGVCVSRKINGVSIPSDNHPSIVFVGEDIKNAKWVTTKKYITPEQVKNIYKL